MRCPWAQWQAFISSLRCVYPRLLASFFPPLFQNPYLFIPIILIFVVVSVDCVGWAAALIYPPIYILWTEHHGPQPAVVDSEIIFMIFFLSTSNLLRFRTSTSSLTCIKKRHGWRTKVRNVNPLLDFPKPYSKQHSASCMQNIYIYIFQLVCISK